MRRAPVAAGLVSLCAVAGLLIGGCPASDGSGGLLGNDNSGGNQPGNARPHAVLSVTPAGGIDSGAQVALDASGSTDDDGDTLAFEWSQSKGATVALSASDGPAVSFIAPSVDKTVELRFSVKVMDGHGGEDTAEAVCIIDAGGEFSGHSQSLVAYRDKLSSNEAWHLLRRAAFGATPEQVQRAVDRGLSATVEELLHKRNVSSSVSRLADAYEDSVPKRWLVYMLEGPNPLYERMALFWHDRFATSRRVATDYRDHNLAVKHWEMLRKHALGNYRDFLEDLTLDPLMLLWLNGADSPKEHPNENYAREFWELFTLGRDTVYTEQDIRAAARAFTGISLLRTDGQDTRPIFDILYHDETDKSIFPERAGADNYNYQGVIELTLAQPEAAQYVARNLFRCFAHDDPDDELVQQLAQEFIDSDFEIAPLVRTILTSQAFFSQASVGNQICSPVEHVVGVARTLDMHIYSEDSQGYLFDQLTDDLAEAGQDLLNPPNVSGWGEDDAWLEDRWIISRVYALGRTMEYGPDHTPDLPYHLLPDVSAWGQRETRDAIVDALAAAFHLDLSEDEHDMYVEVLDQGGWRAFHLEDPQYQPEQVWELIRLMAMHEDVIGR